MPEKGISPTEIENVIGKIANLDIKKVHLLIMKCCHNHCF